MRTKPTREDPFIERFLSAYENGSWADAEIRCLDKELAGAVDALVTRKSDRKKLAIEHTIIEPFVNEKEDFAFFEAAFLKIEEDKSLLVPGKWIQVFIPVGILRGQREQESNVVNSVHAWLRANRLCLPEGFSEHRYTIDGIPEDPAFEIKLTTKVSPLPASPGSLHVRRQQIDNNLGDVVEKALRKKVPKLVKTAADKHILLLERQHWNLPQESILNEIEKRKAIFPELAKVDEIWLLETIFYGTASGGSYHRFELYENGKFVSSLDFEGSDLLARFESKMDETVIEESTT